MTDRIHSITLVLKEDMRTDDAVGLIKALRYFNGVVSVTGNVSDYQDHVAQVRAEDVIRDKLFDAIQEIFKR